MEEKNQAALDIREEFAAKVKADNRKEKLMKWAPVGVLAALILVFCILKGRSFLSLSNLVSILNQWSLPLLVALGLTFVIMIGSIDLSIDGTVGMVGSLTAIFVANSKNTVNLGVLGFLLAILCSVVVGFLIGVIHVKFKIPSFMVSFAFMNICIGIGMLSYSGKPATIRDPLMMAIPKASFLGVPVITWIAIAVLVLCYYIQEYTPFGRHVYAVGTDETIPKAVGINVNKVKIKVFTLAGFCYGVAGVIGALRLGQGQIAIGTDQMFPAQAAVVIGGTALTGGKGGVMNTVVGTLIMTVLINGLTMMGVDPNIKTGIQGVIILAAVILTIKHGSAVISK
ncbi:monosaccharide ABC transporter membrane protein (CUT2 family) [Muricomes intestini]|uniref:Monosaccharide ABC transporter membrane protein (CUT2 family) n=1 Tax=Muricomes intestini TaxID=1796634 RepID=A0A4R3KES3_9FIRM|nr:ABC transporter permease [Muricomes intestini]TCS81141.1 monosaccharide ABC transporter membrane protein (CUT2 family) [Muricomes intestini]